MVLNIKLCPQERAVLTAAGCQAAEGVLGVVASTHLVGVLGMEILS